MTTKIAVIGAGGMARVRTKAFLAAGDVEICAVASRTLSAAKKFGDETGCANCFDDYRRLAETSPDAILVEVPHAAQDDGVLWALDQGLHVLVGGCLASSSAIAEKITSLSAHKKLVVEAGYEARYDAAWETAKRLVTDGTLGKPAAVRAIALWDGDPESWYYNQRVSGGMPLTHMTYCFINPVRWILGDPLCVSALANSVKHTGADMIAEETCVANLQFGDDVVCSMTASFVKPGDVPGWSVLFLCTNGAVEIFPVEQSLTVYRAGGTETMDFSSARSAFEIQAEVFLAAVGGTNECRNAPDATAGDIRVAEAIADSSRKKTTVWVDQAPGA